MSTDSFQRARRPGWWLWWILLLLVIIGGIPMAWIVLRSPHATVQRTELPETDRASLEFVDGVLLQGGTPFTGFVLEHHDNGQLKSRSSVSNGLLQGLSEGWHANGILQVRETFSNGVSHGVRTKFHESGAKLSSVNVVNGQTEGVFERWHENGALSERVQLSNGVPHGESVAFHSDGSLKARARMDHGKLLEQRFWQPGEEWPPASHLQPARE